MHCRTLHFACVLWLSAAVVFSQDQAPSATPAETLQVEPGFQVELLRSATKDEGSWICMTVDDRGRLIISPQDPDRPLRRVTVGPAGVEKIEPMDLPVHTAMGLLYAFDSLYISGNGPAGTGLYRMFDTNADDHFDKLATLKKFPGGGGEHGAHAIVLGPDEHLYIINGNSTHLPDGIDPHSPYRDYREDDLLPRVKDPVATFFDALKVPYGYLLRTDPEGKDWQLVCAGMRNTYDVDFNPDGELFGFDSDMEWEWGAGWYRPTRVTHLVSAAEFGFREGTSKWPTYYPDSTPPVLNIGIGSPTGVKFGTRAKFPDKFRRAFFIADWSYGRILAVQLQPKGSSYRATFAPFVQGKPLNISDLEIGRDGAMYFITGGRGTQSGLYRVSYGGLLAGPDATVQPNNPDNMAASIERGLRHHLESFHGRVDPAAVDFAWPFLGSPDRFVRFAARVAIESQPAGEWQARALAERSADNSLAALLALARVGGDNAQPKLIQALRRQNWASLNERQKLERLRILELSFARHGQPAPDLASSVARELDAVYPENSVALNTELCQLLVYLQDPDVVAKTLNLMAKAKTQEEETKYALYLRLAKNGWTIERRRAYFSWFKTTKAGTMGQGTYPGGSGYFVWSDSAAAEERHPAQVVQWFKDVGRQYGDGASFQAFMDKIRDEAVASLTADERAVLEPLLTSGSSLIPAVPAPQRQFVREWTMQDFPGIGQRPLRGRNFELGREAFTAGQCYVCHRFGNAGGAIGPELTAISSRYTVRDVLESILEPSKVVSEQFQNTLLTLKDGEDVVGLIVDDTPDKLVVLISPLTNTRVQVPKSQIESRTGAKLSPMPEGLANVLTRDEILDLLAYLESGGNRNAPAFKSGSR